METKGEILNKKMTVNFPKFFEKDFILHSHDYALVGLKFNKVCQVSLRNGGLV